VKPFPFHLESKEQRMRLARRRATASLLALIAASAQIQCAGPERGTGSVIETIQRRGALKVGLSTFEPWAMRDRRGELVGFEVDVATKVAADMGVDIEFVPTSWDGIIPALIAGKFDVIIGGLSIRPQRNLTINFTIPYAHSGMGIAAHRALVAGLEWPTGYDSEEVTVTCRRGATACNDVVRLFPKATVRRFDDDLQALQEVLNGNAHAVVSSYPKPVEWAERNPELLFLPTTGNLSQGDEAFGLRKGDPDALNFFSNWIRVNTTNGWLPERYDYWFRTTNWIEDVRPESTAER
jgi:polar amino acid transport system substrate-binding protein